MGADADVTISTTSADREEMFAMPRYVIKGGNVVVEQGGLRDVLSGALMRSSATFEPDIEPVLRERFDQRYGALRQLRRAGAVAAAPARRVARGPRRERRPDAS